MSTKHQILGRIMDLMSSVSEKTVWALCLEMFTGNKNTLLQGSNMTHQPRISDNDKGMRMKKPDYHYDSDDSVNKYF